MDNKEDFSFYSSQTKTLYISLFAWLWIAKTFLQNICCKLTKIKRLSKKLELCSQILNSKHDNKKFWSIMNILTPQKSARKLPNSCAVDGKIIDNLVEIAEKFNITFVVLAQTYLIITLIPQRHLSLTFIYRSVYLLLCIFDLSQPLKYSALLIL